MDILRNIINRLAWAFLPVALISFGLLVGAWSIISNPDTVKDSFKASGLYTSSSSDVVSSLSEQTNLRTTTIDWDDPVIKEALAKALPPSVVEDQSNKAIDSIYDWTKGNSQHLSFSIDLTEAKNDFATYVGEYVRDRTNSLPVCPISQTLTADTNPFTATCRPYGITGDMAAAAVQREVSQSKLFEDSKLTANELTNDAGQPLGAQLEILRSMYAAIKSALFVACIGIVVCSAILLLWSRERQVTLKKLSKLYIVSGVIGLLLAALVGAVIKTIANWESDDAGSVDGAIFKAIASLGNSIQSTWLFWSALFLLVGIACLVWLRFYGLPAKPASGRRSNK